MPAYHLVFNLYFFQENCFLPSANVVQTDKDGQLAYPVQRANAETIVPYGLTPSPVENQLLKLIEDLQPKALEAKFKAPKAKTATPLTELLVHSDASVRRAVAEYIHRQLDTFLNLIAQHKLPVTLGAERRSLVKDLLLAYSSDEILPLLHFRKTPEGIEYRFRLSRNEEVWNIRERQILPLTNTEPAWLLADYTLYRVPGINGNMVSPFLKKDEVLVPAKHTRSYFQHVIAKAARRAQIEAEGFQVEQISHFSSQLEPVENVLERTWLLRLVFTYEGGTAFQPGEGRDRVTTVVFPENGAEITVRQVCRDPESEGTQIHFLEKTGLKQDGKMFALPHPADDITPWLDWLSANKQTLESAGFTIILPTLEGRTIAPLPGMIQLSSRLEGDWFDVQGQVQIGDFTFPFKALLPYLRRRERFFPLQDGSFFLLPEEWFTRYADLAISLQAGQGDGLRLPKGLFTLLEETGMQEDPENETGLPRIGPESIEYEPSNHLQATLRPYQLHGVKWLIGHARQRFGACLADDMGLGKTLQTIALLVWAKETLTPADRTNGQQGRLQLDLFATHQADINPLRALILLPASLVFNWQQELARFAPTALPFVQAHIGPQRSKDWRALASHDVVLTTYQTARQDLDLLEKARWRLLILDESQHIKNRNSEVSQVARRLQADHKIALSGTPIENSLADLWTLMEFINPATLGSFEQFREQFLVPIEKQGNVEAKQKLFDRVRPFFLRRTKEEVAPDLPELTQQVFFSEMAEEQKRRYEQVKSAVRNEILALFQDSKTRLQALQALMRLRQLACHPVLAEPEYEGRSGKFEDVMEQWEVVRQAGHKVLFFSTFEKHLQLFREEFDKNGQPYAWLSGSTQTENRAREVTRFQADPGVQAFFITLKAGGTGLNLTAADYIFLLDPWWNPAAEDQAVARAHRIGREHPVTALRFISRDSIEEKIRDLQERKRALGEGLFSKGSDLPSLSGAEMEELLR